MKEIAQYFSSAEIAMRYFTLAKLSFRNKGAIKTTSDAEKLK